MVNYREILRLRSLGYSQRQVVASAKCSRDTGQCSVQAIRQA
jgi:hypothetical protein